MEKGKDEQDIKVTTDAHKDGRESTGWKSNIPLNGFLLLVLLTAAVFFSQYLSDVAGVTEQVAEEVAKEESTNQSDQAIQTDVLLVDDFNRLVVDSSAVANSVDPAGIWKEPSNQNAWGPSWTILSDTTRSTLTKSAGFVVPILAGDKTWRDLDMRVEFSRPADASVAVLFRYGDRGDHYSLNIDEALHIDSVIEKRDTIGVKIEVLARTKYSRLGGDREVAMISIKGDKIRAGLEGSSFVETVDDQLTFGQVGLMADSSVVFHSVDIRN